MKMDPIETLNSITETLLQSPSALSQSDRRQVLQACDRLRLFESPADSTTRLVFSVCRGYILCFSGTNLLKFYGPLLHNVQ